MIAYDIMNGIEKTMEKVVAQEKGFNLGVMMQEDKCGTMACMIGHYGLTEEAQMHGLDLTRSIVKIQESDGEFEAEQAQISLSGELADEVEFCVGLYAWRGRDKPPLFQLLEYLTIHGFNAIALFGGGVESSRFYGKPPWSVTSEEALEALSAELANHKGYQDWWSAQR